MSRALRRSRIFLVVSCLALAVTAGLSQTAATESAVSVFGGGPVVPGAFSTLLRNGSGVTATFHTSGLEPGGAHTLWWTIFNFPQNCSPPACGLDDVLPFPGNVAAGTSIVNAAGHVIGQNGKASFGAHLVVGDTAGALFGPGLVNPFGAEIHLVVRAHGQPVPGLVDAQISNFTGGCPPNACANVQVSVHRP